MKTKIQLFGFFLMVSFLSIPQLQAGTISGTALFEGTPPIMKAIKIDSDPVCALHHPDGLTKEPAVVGPDGGLKNVFAYVKSGEELDAMIENGEITTPTNPVVLDQNGCHYNPHVFGIMVGQPLEIKNSDQTLHNIHAMPKEGAFNIGMPGKPEPWSVTKSFKAKEVMAPIKCDVHSWMSAFAGVLDHPYFSVTNEQGQFEIKDLPPGDYVVEAWHEKLGTSEQNVTVSEGAPATLTFKFAKPAAAETPEA